MSDKPLKKQTFLGGAAVLALSTAIVKIIGACYKIPLGNLIGDAGFGYFTTAYDIYSVLLCASTKAFRRSNACANTSCEVARLIRT